MSVDLESWIGVYRSSDGGDVSERSLMDRQVTLRTARNEQNVDF